MWFYPGLYLQILTENYHSLKRTNERLKREVSLLKLELEGKKSPKKAKKVLRAKPKDAASKPPTKNRECGLKSRKNVFKVRLYNILLKNMCLYRNFQTLKKKINLKQINRLLSSLPVWLIKDQFSFSLF